MDLTGKRVRVSPAFVARLVATMRGNRASIERWRGTVIREVPGYRGALPGTRFWEVRWDLATAHWNGPWHAANISPLDPGED